MMLLALLGGCPDQTSNLEDAQDSGLSKDAASPDRAVDSGIGADAALDAAEPDAAEPDATDPDATEPDAAEPDAAEPDAAEPDAAEPDAAEPDAAEADAAPVDAGVECMAAGDCALPNAVADCVGFRCVVDQCAGGFGDANRDPSDGCEWPTFVLTLMHDANGAVSAGSSAGLRARFDRRSDVKVRYQDDMLTCTEVEPTSGGWLVCQAWHPITLLDDGTEWAPAVTPDWSISMFNESGYTDHARYRADTHTLVSNQAEQAGVAWFTRDWRSERYAHTSTGGRLRGDVANVVADAAAGVPVMSLAIRPTRVVLTRGGTHVATLDPWHVSVQSGAPSWGIQDDAYHFFQWVSTTGLDDASRWFIGVHTPNGANAYYLPQSWWSEPGWEEVYSHTATGAATSGSIGALLDAIDAGADVRVGIGDLFDPCFVLEIDTASNVRCVARSLVGHQIDANGDAVHTADVYREMRSVRTNGEVVTVRYPVGGSTQLSSTTAAAEVRWFVDRLGFESAFTTGLGGATLAGSRGVLLDAVEGAADVRVIATYPAARIVHACHAMKVDRTLDRAGCVYFADVAGEAHWTFGVANTDGVFREHRICFGTSTSCGVATQVPDTVEWIIRP
jgi:hypothetical protein